MENYCIDRKLKPGKDYPNELIKLINLFNTKDKLKRRVLRREVELIERLLNNYVIYQSNIPVRYASLRLSGTKIKKVEVVSESSAVNKEEFKPWGRRIQKVINKVNTKLALLHPQLLNDPCKISFSYYLEPTALKFSVRYFDRDEAGAIEYWVWLAKVIVGMDYWIFKRCAYCKQIFLSRQRKKYHPECRSKYFSEKYGKEGRNAERQKQYRLRKKKSSRTMK